MTFSVSRAMSSQLNFSNTFSKGIWRSLPCNKPSLFSNINRSHPSFYTETIKRTYATTIQTPIDQDKFFNREREIKALTTMLKMEPQLSIISGPVNSGKTSLILKILKDISKDNKRPVLHIDLRERSFDTVDSLAYSLNDEMASWLHRFNSVSKTLNLNASAYIFTLKTSFESKEKEKLPIDRLNNLFESMSKQLPPHSWWSGTQSPILFIDEASRLNALLKDKDGHAALTNMFEWFVRNTKQHNRFHVILGSSDSFFHLWVQKYIGASRFNSYVIGDLAKSEARLFWDKHVITQLNSIDPKLTAPNFEDAYSVCGGNMYLLKKYFNQYIQKEGKNFEKDDFFLIGIERAKLTNALFKNGNGSVSSHTENGKPIWTREQFITVMKKLVNAEGGFLIYEDLCEEIGQSVVDALINYNLLHLRPSKDFTYDLPDYDATKAVLTAETPSSLVAMRKMLEDMK
jgi:AAA+ ATPase superfamily predicted ATPase